MVLLDFHPQLKTFEKFRLVVFDSLVVAEASGCSSTTFFVVRLVRPEVVALCLVLILVLVFVGALGIVNRFVSGVVVSIVLRPNAVQTAHVIQVRLINHDEHEKRRHPD